MKRKIRTIRHILDNNINTLLTYLVLVPLDNTDNPKYATINQSDFDMLMELGVSPIWATNNDGHVVVWGPKARRHIRVARLIMDAKAGEGVSVIDGDDRNLRRSNLVLGTWSISKSRDRDFVTKYIQDITKVRPKATHIYGELAAHSWEFRPMNNSKKGII